MTRLFLNLNLTIVKKIPIRQTYSALLPAYQRKWISVKQRAMIITPSSLQRQRIPSNRRKYQVMSLLRIFIIIIPLTVVAGLGIIMPTLTPKSRATSNGARLFNKIRRGTYDQYTPDVGDPYYFCRVCRIRSGSKSDYYEHLTAHHKMQLIPIEYWRPDHPDIIPAEFDNSNSCADCRIVFSVNLHYRNHLKEVHRIHLFNWSRAERQARVDAIFYPKESVLHFVKLSISPNQSVYRCFQCTKSVKVLRSIVKHYFNEHNTIAEICMLEDDGMNKENSG